MDAPDPNQHPVFVYELRPRSVPPELPTSSEPDPHAETPFAASFEARRGFPRYDAPWVVAPFPSDAIRVQAGGEALALDWRSRRRDASRLAN